MVIHSPQRLSLTRPWPSSRASPTSPIPTAENDQVRLVHAKRILLGDFSKIAKVAFESGFSSLSAL